MVIDQCAPRQDWQRRPDGRCAGRSILAEYILEDHDGLPIECSVCGAVDRWLPLFMSGGEDPEAFTCQHRPDPVTGRRQVAVVARSQVGGYLCKASLVPGAA